MLFQLICIPVQYNHYLYIFFFSWRQLVMFMDCRCFSVKCSSKIHLVQMRCENCTKGWAIPFTVKSLRGWSLSMLSSLKGPALALWCQEERHRGIKETNHDCFHISDQWVYPEGICSSEGVVWSFQYHMIYTGKYRYLCRGCMYM